MILVKNINFDISSKAEGNIFFFNFADIRGQNFRKNTGIESNKKSKIYEIVLKRKRYSNDSKGEV